MANEIEIQVRLFEKRLEEERLKGKWKVLGGWEIITRTLYETEKGSVEGEIKNVWASRGRVKV